MTADGPDKKRIYYSRRTGKKNTAVEFDSLKKIFLGVFEEFERKQYFDEYFGKKCPDAENGIIPGRVGSDIESYVLRKLRKDNLWPIKEKYQEYAEEDLFDMVEFLFDHISIPIKDGEAYFHGWDGCGYHYKNFDDIGFAQIEYTDQINEFLNDYGDGYELSSDGEIYSLLREEFRPLLKASIPTDDPENIENKVRKAIDKFRRYGSTLDERKEAVRTLADCLEYIRKDLQKVITKKDDDDLFNIANNFGVRHHNDKQKTNYDHAIWLSWMFYFYLATIHAGLRLMNKRNQ